MTDRVNAILSIIDRACLWCVVGAAVYVLSYLAIKADRDPPALISPSCIVTPAKAVK